MRFRSFQIDFLFTIYSSKHSFMLTFEYKIFVNISRFNNAALTQRGHYRIALSLDETGPAKLDRVTHYGEGGQVDGGVYFSKCAYISSGRDTFPDLGSCILHLSTPITHYLLNPTDHSLQIFLNVELICSAGDNLPKGEGAFNVLNRRRIAITLTPGYNNNHFITVTSGPIQIGAIGLQLHSSLTGITGDASTSPPLTCKYGTHPIPTFYSLLFDTTLSDNRHSNGPVFSGQAHARQVFRVLEGIIQQSYADIRKTLISYSSFTNIQIPDMPENLVLDDDLAIVLQSPVQQVSLARNISEVLSDLSVILHKLWKKYVANIYGNESVIKHLAIIYHSEKVQYLRQSVRSSTTDSTFCNENAYLDDDTQIKNTQQQNYYLHTRPRVYCVETMGSLQDKIFIEEVIYTPIQEAVSQNQLNRINGRVDSVERPEFSSISTDKYIQNNNNKHQSFSRSPVHKPLVRTSGLSGEIIRPKNPTNDVIAFHTPVHHVPSNNTFTPSRKTADDNGDADIQLLCNCLPFRRRVKREKKKIPRLKNYKSQEEFVYPTHYIGGGTGRNLTPLSSVSATGVNPRSYLEGSTGNKRRSHPNIKLCHSPTPHSKMNTSSDTTSDSGPKLRTARSLLEESSRSSQNCTDLDDVIDMSYNSHDTSRASVEEDREVKEVASVSQLVVTLELDAQSQSIAGSGFHVGNPSFIEENKGEVLCKHEVLPRIELEDDLGNSALERSIQLHGDIVSSSPIPVSHCSRSLEFSHSSGHYKTASYNSFRNRDLTTVPISKIQFRDFTSPYLPPPLFYEYSKDYHLIICVHGLDGNFYDLRLYKTFLTLALPRENLEFLMSISNQGKTYSSIEDMADNLLYEIYEYLHIYGSTPPKYISFIGHSLGNLVIRSLLNKKDMEPLLDLLSVFVSLCSPHLGSLVYTSGFVQAGMWILQKWHKSTSILQMQLKDGDNPRESFIYRLSSSRGIQRFKSIILVGSPQDKYTPYFSSLLHPCPNYEQVPLYREMLENFLAVLKHRDLQLVRYKVHYNIPPSPGNFIGRSAHIAVLDCEQFVEKFILTCLAPYFADTRLHL